MQNALQASGTKNDKERIFGVKFFFSLVLHITLFGMVTSSINIEMNKIFLT